MTTRRYMSRILLPIVALGATTLAACAAPDGTPVVEDKFPDAISTDGLARLRACEAGGDYGSVGGGGSFRGAYQFTRQTWNATAGRFYPELQGVDPAAAAPWDQDRMARALWAIGGPRNWPVCSKRV